MSRNKGAAVKLIRYAVFVLIILFAGFFAAHFIVQRTVVHGGSMQPTLYDGDNLIIDRVSYASFDPKRYDIVVFSFRKRTGYILYQAGDRTSGRDCTDYGRW